MILLKKEPMNVLTEFNMLWRMEGGLVKEVSLLPDQLSKENTELQVTAISFFSMCVCLSTIKKRKNCRN